MKKSLDSFKTRMSLSVGGKTFDYFSLAALAERGFDLTKMPLSMKVFLENLLRHEDGAVVKKADIEAVAKTVGVKPAEREVFFMPARVVMQDFTGVPAVVDLAAMRDAIKKLGGDPARINPFQPVRALSSRAGLMRFSRSLKSLIRAPSRTSAASANSKLNFAAASGASITTRKILWLSQFPDGDTS